MTVSARTPSPIGEIVLTADENALTGLYFVGQKHFPAALPPLGENPFFAAAAEWLNAYFAGENPAPTVPLSLTGTPFQRAVWRELLQIPYGQTVTYGELARRVGCLSARAVGQAVGRNPVSILVPCHRVTGADGKLTGYAGGTERKEFLLNLETIHKGELHNGIHQTGRL